MKKEYDFSKMKEIKNPYIGKKTVMATLDNSIFDLSPAEKLQLVEDLWDDLASTPQEVPIHDWQKRELDHRKANLTESPLKASSWDEVKQRVRSFNHAE